MQEISGAGGQACTTCTKASGTERLQNNPSPDKRVKWAVWQPGPAVIAVVVDILQVSNSESNILICRTVMFLTLCRLLALDYWKYGVSQGAPQH